MLSRNSGSRRSFARSDAQRRAENVLRITTDSAVQAFSFDMREVGEPLTIGVSSIDPACQASPVYTLMPADRAGCMCIFDRLEEQKRNSVLVLGILFLCLDFFSHVAEGLKTYLMWPLLASSCIIVVVSPICLITPPLCHCNFCPWRLCTITILFHV